MEADITSSKELYEKLLDNKKLFDVNYGFTFPFIIGAYHIMGIFDETDLQSKLCLNKLFSIILDTAKGKNMAVARCSTCNYNFILYCESEEIMEYRDSFVSLDKMVYTDEEPIHSIETIDDLINKIWEDCEKNIKEKKFSIENREWREFNQEELDKINGLN